MPDHDNLDNPDPNPMLSELPLPLRRLLEWDFLLVLAASIWALMVIIIAIRSGAAWVQLTFEGLSKLDGHKVPYPTTYGYLRELNHGLFYLILAPTFIWFALKLLREIDSTVDHLATQGRLQLVMPNEQPTAPANVLSWISKRNRQVCGCLLIAAILVSPFFMIAPELGHLRESAPNVGWVQSPNLPTLDPQHPVTLRNFKEKLAGAQELYGEHYDEAILKKVAFAKGRTSVDRLWFRWLFWLALIMENTFVAFALWVGVKILFLLGLISLAFHGSSYPQPRHKPFLKIDLNFEDEENKRFGLVSLDKLYRGSAWLVLITLIAFYLQQISNVSKGPVFWPDPSKGIGYPQLGTLIAPTLIIVAILLIPAVIYVRLLSRAKNREIRRLSKEILRLKALRDAVTTDENERKGIQELIDEATVKIILAEQQTPWPKGDKEFWAVIIAEGIILFVAIFGGSSGGSPGNSPAGWIISVSLAVPALIDEICK